MKRMENYLILSPDTFIWADGENGVMYHTETHALYRFVLAGLIRKYCNALQDIHQMYVVSIDPQDWEDEAFSEWVHQVVAFRLGELREKEADKRKPISFPPLLNLQSDVDKLQSRADRNVGEFAALNWNECTLYMGGKSKHPDWFKQIPYPVNDERAMDLGALKSFFSTADHTSLNTLHVVGDWFAHPSKVEFADWLSTFQVKINFYLTESCVLQNMEEWKTSLFPNFELHIYYEGKAETASLHRYLTTAKVPFRWVYLISSADQSEELEHLEAEYGNSAVEVHPIYTGNNRSFFAENVFLTEEEILHPHCDKQDVFAHQVMNTNFWGRLSILPDGKVYANVNLPPIGTVKKRIYDLIVDEMKSRRAWRWTRDDMDVCKDCLFRHLCPSPSNYELVMDKTNICHIQR